MPMFDALHASASGIRLHRTWIDAVSDNVANINTVRPPDQEAFRARLVVAQSVGYGQPDGGGGVRVAGVVFGDAEGRLVHEPGHPLADADGMVRYPDIELADQMVQLLVAQRGYQANVAVVERARDAYQSALGIGR